ncbi:Translation initiation factor 3 subunit J component [Coemansia sp. RSA 2611]|nr:Translation initiation factor 3 subunit J component [Coemansia sp. RSA 2705]KAJ2321284.1 Translation initiation factor 3 subunit J component [Coemansia sp. RSA 2704]KAJ2382831.1 Translation initiation factor 3 subunit J component [Coemansia sp. RSA 2611]
MSDWEQLDSEEEAVQKVAKSKWGDEDADSAGEAPDDWDASSSESESEKKVGVPAPKPKTKKSLSERIAERQAEREAKKAEARAAAEDSDEDDAQSRKQRERQMQLESDRQIAEDLFSGLTIKDTQVQDTLTTLNPKTQEDFDEFQRALVERIQKAQSSRLYFSFLEKLVRELALPLKDSEIRKISSTLTAVASEKQKATRDQTKGKKKNKKTTLAGAPAKGQMDMTDYSRYDDFDDFM